jgi:hypothetical protein
MTSASGAPGTPLPAGWKRGLALLVLAATTSWPLVHHGIVRTRGLNPWKWFGWAMYTTPPVRVRAEVWTPEGRPLDLRGVAPGAAQAALAAYRSWSSEVQELGGASAPDAFAATIFTAYPDVERFEVRAFAVRMDRESALLVERPVEGSPFPYRR